MVCFHSYSLTIAIICRLRRLMRRPEDKERNRTVAVVHFTDQNWLPKTVYCIRCVMVCKIGFTNWEHVYMRPKVNSNRFEISQRDKISLRCEVTSLSAFTWLQAEWNSLRCKFHFGQFRSNFKSQSVFHVNSKCPQWKKVAQNY